MECFITQPIHHAAIEFLNSRGIATRYASAPEMAVVAQEIGAAQAVITRDLGLDSTVIAQAPALKIISCHGAGTNRIDTAAAQARGITVTNAPGTNSQSVAELAIGLILSCARNISAADHAVRAGDWDYRYRCTGVELHGKTLGLVGFGAIAQKLSVIARAGFGMRVISWSPSVAPPVFEAYGVQRCETPEELLAQADVISIHRAGAQGDASLINAQTLKLVKPEAIVINVGRGFAINQHDLAQALAEKRLHSAALDVLQCEPPQSDDPILQAPSLTLTPHLGATTEESLKRMALLCASQVHQALNGQNPPHRVV